MEKRWLTYHDGAPDINRRLPVRVEPAPLTDMDWIGRSVRATQKWKKSGLGADVLNSPAGGLAGPADRLHQYDAKIAAACHVGRFGHSFRLAPATATP